MISNNNKYNDNSSLNTKSKFNRHKPEFKGKKKVFNTDKCEEGTASQGSISGNKTLLQDNAVSFELYSFGGN